jgi:hypothetical protein
VTTAKDFSNLARSHFKSRVHLPFDSAELKEKTQSRIVSSTNSSLDIALKDYIIKGLTYKKSMGIEAQA